MTSVVLPRRIGSWFSITVAGRRRAPTTRWRVFDCPNSRSNGGATHVNRTGTRHVSIRNGFLFRGEVNHVRNSRDQAVLSTQQRQSRRKKKQNGATQTVDERNVPYLYARVSYTNERATRGVFSTFFHRLYTFCSRRPTTNAHARGACAYIYPYYRYTTAYTRTRGKTVPQYVRRREQAEEDLQPRKLYYSGRLAPARGK